MSASAGRAVRTGAGRARRAAAAVLATAVGLGGLAACSDDPVGPQPGPAAADLQVLEDRVTALEERVSALEDAPAAEEPTEQAPPSEDEPGVLGDAEALIGQGVVVSGEVTEPVTATDVGAAFRIAGASGEPILVIMATPPDGIGAGDEVEVSGRVVRIAEETFEVDFGIAADQLFEDTTAFFADSGGQIAISADRLEVVQDGAG